MNIKVICPGVTLCRHKTEQFKTASVSINIITPLDSDATKKALLINLLSRTNAHYPTLAQMNRRLGSLYAATISPRTSKIGEAHVLSLSMSCLDNRFALHGDSIIEEALELLLSCLFDADITEENLSREKRLLKEKIDSERDDKRLYALQRLFEEMCKGEKYSISRHGDKALIDNITAADLTALWKRLLKESAFQICVVGNFDENSIETLLAERFSALDRAVVKTVSTEFISHADTSKTVTESQKVQQGKLVIGLRAGTESTMDNYAAMKMMTAIFGAGTFSKLFTNVREKMSLCYYCSAGLIATKGIITVQSGVETDNAQKALDAILGELEEMKKGNFTEEDIAAAKMSFADSMRSVTDSIASIDSYFLSQCTEERFITPEEYVAMTEKVTYEEIIDAAKGVTLDTVYILKGEKEAEV